MENHYRIHGINIKWNIHKDDPTYLKLESYPNCHLLNPIFYRNSFEPDSTFTFDDKIKTERLADQFFIEASYIILKTDVHKENFEDLRKFLKLFVKNVRIESKQATITPNYEFSSISMTKLINLERDDNLSLIHI